MPLLICLTFLQADLLRYCLKVFSQAELLSGSPGKIDFRKKMTKIHPSLHFPRWSFGSEGHTRLEKLIKVQRY